MRRSSVPQMMPTSERMTRPRPIVAITMEGLDRTLGGSVLHLGIGQSLEAGGAVAGATTQQGIALESVTPVLHEPSPGSAIPAAATILETPR